MQQDRREARLGNRRTWILILAAALVPLLAAGYVAYWHWAAERLAEGVATWRQEQRRRGYEIAYREPEITGFPGRATMIFRDAQISAPGGWSYRGPPLTARAEPWRPFRIELELSGGHRFADGQGSEIQITLDRGRAAVLLNRRGGFDRLHFETLGLAVDHPQGSLTAERATADFGPLRPGAAERRETLELGLDLARLLLPAEIDAPLGHALEQLEIVATLHGRIGPGDRRRALADWRESGGHMEIHRLTLRWGPLSAEGRGTITLDARFRPQGTLQTRFQGLDRTLDRLAQAGLVDPAQARTGKSLLALLARPSDGKQAAAITLPVQLNRGRLYLGPLAIARLSPVL